jgi:ABC-2 type transport system ATP-binding protein
MTTLEAAQLTRRYGDVVAIDDVSLAIAPGQIAGFVGRNGAGKTTTLRMLMGIAAPDGGEIRLDGRAVTAADRTRFGYLPEQRGLYVRMRVREQLVYLARLRGLDRGAAESAAARWLDRLGLQGRRDDRIEELSHGNQQRVQLAAALVHDPTHVLLDEPFNGLDPVGVAVLSEVLRELADAGVAVLLSSHQLDLVETLCDAVTIVDAGRVVARGTLEELASALPRRLVVEVEGAGPEWAARLGLTVLDAAGGRLRLLLPDDADPQLVLAAAIAAGPIVHFGIERPRLAETFLAAVGAPPAASTLAVAA